MVSGLVWGMGGGGGGGVDSQVLVLITLDEVVQCVALGIDSLSHFWSHDSRLGDGKGKDLAVVGQRDLPDCFEGFEYLFWGEAHADVTVVVGLVTSIGTCNKGRGLLCPSQHNSPVVWFSIAFFAVLLLLRSD